MFSDEANIQAEPDGGHRNVWRKPTEKFCDFDLDTSRKFPTSIMIWGLISSHGISDCQVLEGRLNGGGYIGILEKKLLPFITMETSHSNRIMHLVI